MTLTLFVVIVLLVIVIMQANDFVTAVRIAIVNFIKKVGAFITSPFRKEKKPKAPKAPKVSRKERRRQAKETKLRKEKYDEYIMTRAIYNTDFVNTDPEVKNIVKKHSQEREYEELKKNLKSK